MENSKEDIIDFEAIFRTVWTRRKVFYIVLPIVFVLSCGIILCVPRYYTSKVVLAPEAQLVTPSNSIMALASTFGFNLGNMATSDALYPSLYPDVVSSPDFLVKLCNVKVVTYDGGYEGSYYNYLCEKRRYPFWKRWIAAVKQLFTFDKEESVSPSAVTKNSDDIDIFMLTKRQAGALDIMRGNIKCDVDKKTDVITIIVTDQDKLVCATIANVVCSSLQEFITDYRTRKASVDADYYRNMMQMMNEEYKESSRRYIDYVDGHAGLSLERYRIEQQDLESDMQTYYTAYTTFHKQYMAAQSRLQEDIPVFTEIVSSSVPLKPAGPKRMIFVLAMTVLSAIVTAVVIFLKKSAETKH